MPAWGAGRTAQRLPAAECEPEDQACKDREAERSHDSIAQTYADAGPALT